MWHMWGSGALRGVEEKSLLEDLDVDGRIILKFKVT
jgi:hypothetical protein